MGKYLDIINSTSSEGGKLKDVQFSPTENDFDEAKIIYGSIDPRKDKSVDHQYWEDILWNAWHFTKPLFNILHGIRCGGGELTLTRDSFRLLSGEWTTEEWEEIKQKNLNPIKDKLIWILMLTKFGKVTEETIPKGLFATRPEKEVVTDVDQGRLFG